MHGIVALRTGQADARACNTQVHAMAFGATKRAVAVHIILAAQCLAMNSSCVGITCVQLAITPRMPAMYSVIFSSGYTSTSAW
jgi:hypothetical protein